MDLEKIGIGTGRDPDLTLTTTQSPNSGRDSKMIKSTMSVVTGYKKLIFTIVDPESFLIIHVNLY